MNEAETRAELIDPALREAGWGVVDGSRIRREEVISVGRILGSGKHAARDIADYVLIHRNQKLAVIEAKRRDAPVTEGLAQAKRYAAKLDTRFAFSTNGMGIYRVDMQTGSESPVDRFPTPDELWAETFAEANEWRDRFAAVPFEDKGGMWQPRYYQHNAITRALEAIAKGQTRILLTLATGTGKTCIAFQIAWKLFQSRWTPAGDAKRRPRILFLADRNILANQASNDFSAFPDDARIRIDPKKVRELGRVPKNGSVFLTIFQTFMSGRDAEGNPTPNFYDYPPDFFDFVIVDECHRGGANDESTWRGILEYFAPAVQLGLTATPKRTFNADTYAYFGDPVYIYSLKDGINDGYLTPFKVVQYSTTIDNYIYTLDDEVLEGEIEEGKRYEEPDFNRIIVIKEREACRVCLFMDAIDQSQKTLVFCATQEHALAVRDLINQMKHSPDPDYCVRVTADDGAQGELALRTFQDNEKTIPTILTTSQKLSTGVDARNVRHIVLMRPIRSMIEFKQIIGRGTRLFDGKDYFTIHDFVKAYEHFNDPAWDGEPIDPTPPKPRPDTPDPDDPDDPDEPDDPSVPDPLTPKPPRERIRIKLADGKERTIEHMKSTSFWDPDGKPIPATEFIQRLFGDLPSLFKNEEELRELWSRPDTRRKLLEGLAEKGYGTDALAEVSRLIRAEKSDIYDVLGYIAFAMAPVTREERVASRRKVIFSSYADNQQEFLSFVLDQYIREGVTELDQDKLPHLLEVKYHGIHDAVAHLGQVDEIAALFNGFQRYLYAQSVA